MAEEIHSVTSSEWKLVQERLDDLENLVTDLKLKLEILGECKCNRSNSDLETQPSDDEETESLIGLNPHLNSISAATGILGISGQSIFQLKEALTSGMPDAHNTPDSAANLATGSHLSDSISFSDDDGNPVSTRCTLRLSNGIRIHDIEKYRRLQLKLTRFDQLEVTASGTSSTSEFYIASNKSTLTSTNKASRISSKNHSGHRRKGSGVRVEHTSAPSSSDEKRFICHFCSNRFGNKSHLTRHTRVHTGDKPFPCNSCSMKFSQKSTLTTHTRVHTGDKPFECGFCSKKFNHKQSLTIHSRVHTGDEPFECAFCPMKFKQSPRLVTHMRCHTGERPYACQLCSKTFPDPSSLQRHVRVHTREKPYSCSLCTEVFARSDSLKLHLKRHPGETPQRQGQIQHEDVPGSLSS